jgi:hypothetical protein
MDLIPCPDGYLLDSNSALAAGHHTLNDYLVAVEQTGWKAALKDINGIRDKSRKLLAWKALLERVQWLEKENPSSPALSSFRGLAEAIEKWKLSPSENDLIEVLERTWAVASFLAPYTPVPHLMTHLEENGLTERLAAAIREFRARVWDQTLRVNQVSLQLFRSRLDMLAWRDEWTAIDLKRCWSEQIRADFRDMRGTDKEVWRRLLYGIHGDEGTRPTASWLAQSRRHVEAIGCGEFNSRVAGWFSPLGSMSAQRLSREGSYLLRSFVWLAADSKSPDMLAQIREIRAVNFKPASNGEKVIRAATEALGESNPPTKAPAYPPSLDSLIARALTAVLSPGTSFGLGNLSSRIHIQGEVVQVCGDLDSYRVHISTGAIFRNSDGQRVIVTDLHPRFALADVLDFGGTKELLQHILILAEDAQNRAALSFYRE